MHKHSISRGHILTGPQRDILTKLEVRGSLSESQLGSDARADLLLLKDLGYIKNHGFLFHIQRSGIDAVRRSL